jgi:hypothetical protein
MLIHAFSSCWLSLHSCVRSLSLSLVRFVPNSFCRGSQLFACRCFNWSPNVIDCKPREVAFNENFHVGTVDTLRVPSWSPTPISKTNLSQKRSSVVGTSGTAISGQCRWPVNAGQNNQTHERSHRTGFRDNRQSGPRPARHENGTLLCKSLLAAAWATPNPRVDIPLACMCECVCMGDIIGLGQLGHPPDPQLSSGGFTQTPRLGDPPPLPPLIFWKR